jgi:hypothetical protein
VAEPKARYELNKVSSIRVLGQSTWMRGELALPPPEPCGLLIERGIKLEGRDDGHHGGDGPTDPWSGRLVTPPTAPRWLGRLLSLKAWGDGMTPHIENVRCWINRRASKTKVRFPNTISHLFSRIGLKSGAASAVAGLWISEGTWTSSGAAVADNSSGGRSIGVPVTEPKANDGQNKVNNTLHQIEEIGWCGRHHGGWILRGWTYW